MSAHDLAQRLTEAFAEPRSPRDGVRIDQRDQAPAGRPTRPAGLDLEAVLRSRTSTRFFGPDPVERDEVETLLDGALAADATGWPEQHVRVPLEPAVLALRVTGLPSGIYRWDDGRLARTASLTVAEAAELTVQTEFAGAAAIVSLAADLTRADQDGAHGYRLLMSRAGAAAYDMWLRAVALGRVGTVFAGFIPAAVRVALDSDGSTRHQLFAFACGAPQPTGGLVAGAHPHPAERR